MKRLIPIFAILALTAIAVLDFPFSQVRQVSDPAVLAELDALRVENTELRQTVQVLLQVADLVRIQDIDTGIVVDLRYATEDNFTGRPVYPAHVALLRRETAEKLAAANAELMASGYRIKIWDAYRPYHIHQLLWSLAGEKQYYFADPRYGSVHNRGAAVDVTLLDAWGREVEMPTDFDDFTGAAHRRSSMSSEARANMELLTEVMVRHGFLPIEFEWWHFEDSQWWKYPLLDLPLELSGRQDSP